MPSRATYQASGWICTSISVAVTTGIDSTTYIDSKGIDRVGCGAVPGALQYGPVCFPKKRHISIGVVESHVSAGG